MALDKRKVLENARKFVQKGAVEKALNEYQRLLKLDPRDAKIRLEIGDAYRRWGKVEEAVEAYLKVANQYMSEGFDARAVAVFKQILNLDPECYSAYEPLADLYQRMGLIAESIQSLQVAADGFHKQGRKQDALALLRKMAILDPTNTSSRIKVADLLNQEGMREAALAEYDGALVVLQSHGDHEAVESVFKRILEVDPKRVATLRQYARSLLAMARPAEAEGFAKRALEVEPREIQNFELLGEIYRTTKDTEAITRTFRGLAKLHRERGEEDLAREILQRLAPAVEFAGSASVDGLDRKPMDEPDAYVSDPGDLFGGRDELDIELDVGEYDDAFLPDDTFDDGVGDLDDELTIVAPRATAPAENPPPSLVLSPAEIAQKLAEASVYLRYGKCGPAIENLQTIIASDPHHLPALENLGEAHAENGDAAGAVEAWLRAARVAYDSGEMASLGVLRDRIAALDEVAARGLDPLVARATDGSPDSGDGEYLDTNDSVTENGVSPPLPDDSVLPLEVDIDLGDALGLDVDVEGDGDSDGDLAIESAIELDAIADIDTELGIESGLEFDTDVEIEIEPGPADVYDEIGAEASGWMDESIAEETASQSLVEAASPRSIAPASNVGAPATHPVAAPGSSQDTLGASASTSQRILEDLEEAEFYLEQGITEEAEAIFKRLLRIAPNHPTVLVRLGELAAARGEDPTLDVDASESELSAPDLGGMHVPEVAVPEAALPDVAAPELEFDAVFTDDSEEDAQSGGDGSWRDVQTGEYEIELPPDEPESEGVAISPFAPSASPDDTCDLSDPTSSIRSGSAAYAEDTFDLAAELSQAIDDDALGAPYDHMGEGGDGFAAVFQEFKRAVSASLSEEDYETHYDLGIAYREMGLFDDAIHEFRTSTGCPARHVDGLHMIGLCSLDTGRVPDAITQFGEALLVSTISDDQRLAVRFELGRAFRFAGDIANARDAFEAVAAIDPLFCDVELELVELEKQKAEEIAPEEVDGGYESFDDLMSEVSALQAEGASKMENFDDLFCDDAEDESELSASGAIFRDRKRKKISSV